MRNLYSSPTQFWKILAATNYLICRGTFGGLVLLSWQTGEIISQMEVLVPYQTSMGIHTIASQDGQSLYLLASCLDGQYWNASWRVTKITLSLNFNTYQQDWQIVVADEVFPSITITQNGDYLYVCGTYFDALSNTTVKIRRINPQNGETVWTQNIYGPNELCHQGLINNGDNVIVYGFNYENYQPTMINYNQEGIPIWLYSAPLPEGDFLHATYKNAVWDGNVLILTGLALYSNQTCENSRIWLSAVSIATANDDPIAPAIPNPELSCYPNPFRGSTNIKFNQIDNSPTTVTIYNIRGQLVRTLVNNQKLSPGEHMVVWDGKTNSGQPAVAGIYFYKITSGRFSSTRKMIVMK